ncbi:MAG: hypothetical protein M0Q13_07215 [Methanothrix sp.]|nr:hypothetical protein [Methanothrix sp.]
MRATLNSFYANKSSRTLRLGDVVSGFVTAIPTQDEPITKSFVNYNVEVKLPSYLVVLTPCCSIKEKTISLAPLVEAKRKPFFKNKNYREDMTLLNQPHLPNEWRELGEEVSSDSDGEAIYAYDTLFIYAEDPRLPKYPVKIPIEGKKFEEFEAGYYFIDFRNISKVKCSCIAHEEEKKPNYEDLLLKMLSSKILEISIDARADLRNKLAYYYLRVPKEDLIEQS